MVPCTMPCNFRSPGCIAHHGGCNGTRHLNGFGIYASNGGDTHGSEAKERGCNVDCEYFWVWIVGRDEMVKSDSVVIDAAIAMDNGQFK
jgi:hypothetical protein